MSYQDIPINNLDKTTPKTIKQFQSVGVQTLWDLLNYFPIKHTDYGKAKQIATLQDGELTTVQGEVIQVDIKYVRANLKILQIILSDQTDKIIINWFNQVFLHQVFRLGMKIAVAGTVKRFGLNLTLEPKEYEIVRTGKLIHTTGLVPTYAQTRGLSTRTIREKIWQTLERKLEIEEILPNNVIKKHNLINLTQAYKQIHFPDNLSQLKSAKKRLAFNELYFMHLSNLVVREQWAKQKLTEAIQINSDSLYRLKALQDNLPFTLTQAQKRCLQEIITDLKKNIPMNRFLQGDVGSGKTIIAALASYLAYLDNKRTLMMAPTEILAQQHYQTMTQIFAHTPVEIALQTSSVKQAQTNKAHIVVGTHALLSENFNLEQVALVVIDEQHRFGVAQRAALKNKGCNPHLLTMTATPIPRTISLVKYGELDLSIIDEMPAGRKIIKTSLVPKNKRTSAYNWIKTAILSQNQQVYIVCPFVNESQEETLQSVRAATKEYDQLVKIFAPWRVGLLHGKLKNKEKTQVLQDFKLGNLKILVSTSVVEVGIDAASATVMIIEGAERFGLAQLHQLRGRVGRSDLQSYCLLFTSDDLPDTHTRLQFFAKHHRGIELAEYDLKIRGSGELYGTRQHGNIDAFRIADPLDVELIQTTKQVAEEVFDSGFLQHNPRLREQIEQTKMTKVSQD